MEISQIKKDLHKATLVENSASQQHTSKGESCVYQTTYRNCPMPTFIAKHQRVKGLCANSLEIVSHYSKNPSSAILFVTAISHAESC